MPNYELLIDFFNEYNNHYKELLSFENTKFQYIVSNNVIELGNSLGKEQALIMKGNSLEAKRLSLLEKQGLKGVKFQDIIDDAPEQYSYKLSSLFSELSKYVSETKRINDEALSAVKTRLSAIDQKLSKQSNDVYDGKGGKKHTSNTFSSLAKNV